MSGIIASVFRQVKPVDAASRTALVDETLTGFVWRTSGAHQVYVGLMAVSVALLNFAASLGEDKGTLEDLYEPYLLQAGFLQRTPRGRIASSEAYRHLGILPPRREGSLF